MIFGYEVSLKTCGLTTLERHRNRRALSKLTRVSLGGILYCERGSSNWNQTKQLEAMKETSGQKFCSARDLCSWSGLDDSTVSDDTVDTVS